MTVRMPKRKFLSGLGGAAVEVRFGTWALAAAKERTLIGWLSGSASKVAKLFADDFLMAKRLPTVYGYREHVLAGGLVSYGVDLRWCYRRGAYFVDKILRGTPPGELPVEFPTKMTLSINVKTAKVLGIAVPPKLLDFADEVIE